MCDWCSSPMTANKTFIHTYIIHEQNSYKHTSVTEKNIYIQTSIRTILTHNVHNFFQTYIVDTQYSIILNTQPTYKHRNLTHNKHTHVYNIHRSHLLTARPHTGRMARARMERLPKHDLVREREGESEKARGTEGGRDREEEVGGYHHQSQLSTQMHTKHTNTRIIT